MPRGRWTRKNIKARTDDVTSISVTKISPADGGHIIMFPDLKQVTYVTSGNEIRLIPSGQVIDLDTSHCNFGGSRRWFLCPKCRKRTLKLYEISGVFYCRKCQGLPYSSQRESEADRLMRKIRRLRKRLEASSDLTVPIVHKPKGMHWKTFNWLRLQESRANLKYILKLKKELMAQTSPER